MLNCCRIETGLDKFVTWDYIHFDPFMKPLSRLCRLTIFGNDPMVEEDISSLLLIRNGEERGHRVGVKISWRFF